NVGASQAGSSFVSQQKAVLTMFQRVPLPKGTVTDRNGMGELQIDPVGSASQARDAYSRSRNPLQDFLDLQCTDACPPPWAPGDGLNVSQQYQVDDPDAAHVCDGLSTALPAVFGSATRAEHVAQEFQGVACAFSVRSRSTLVLVTVLRHDSGPTGISVE